MTVTLDDICRAAERIRGVAERTPLQPAWGLVPADTLWLKCENLQRTGSFKLRGAYNAVASLSADERQRGVITYSSGNHGQAVAAAAHLLDAPAVIVMPEDAIPVKVENTRAWGAEVVFAGHTSLDRQERAEQLAAAHGYSVIPPFDDPRIIAGQGTVGLEIVDQLPNVEVVVVQVGGGGLISGVATAVKALRPQVEVIGVEPAGAADAQQSLHEGRVVTLERIQTVADGLRTSRVGTLNFETIRQHVDRIVTVEEQAILDAVALLALRSHLVAEPSGAVAPAAVLSGAVQVGERKVAAVISGGNIAPDRLEACIAAAR
ncbi:MAG TPA: threonine/serine dehydratase [Chloroflexota bacterium]|nr:threonine/serine dehydratase [Chloroflexota bacterium]